MSTPEAIRLADESAALASSPYLKPIDMSVTIAQALRANAAELRRMAALNAELVDGLKQVLAAAPEIDGASDEDLAAAANDPDPEIQVQADAFIFIRALIAKAEGGAA